MGDNKRRKVSYVRGVGIRRILREQSVSEDTDYVENPFVKIKDE